MVMHNRKIGLGYILKGQNMYPINEKLYAFCFLPYTHLLLFNSRDHGRTRIQAQLHHLVWLLL